MLSHERNLLLSKAKDSLPKKIFPLSGTSCSVRFTYFHKKEMSQRVESTRKRQMCCIKCLKCQKRYLLLSNQGNCWENVSWYEPLNYIRKSLQNMWYTDQEPTFFCVKPDLAISENTWNLCAEIAVKFQHNAIFI